MSEIELNEIKLEEVNGGGHGKFIFYTVVAGDTLWMIAKRFKTTTLILSTLNHLSYDRIVVGQKLIIPR